MARKRKPIGEILKAWGIVDDRRIDEALKVAKGSRARIGEALVKLGHASQSEVAKALASQFDMEFVDLDQPNVIQRENLSLIPEDLIKKYLVLPMGKSSNRLKVLVHDPMDLQLIDDLRFRLGVEIDLALGAKDKIKEYIDNAMSGTQKSIDQLTKDLSVDVSMDRGTSLDIEAVGAGDDAKGAGQAPIIRLVHKIIQEAVYNRVSDIHIEPFEDRVRLRYRIDGVCHEWDTLPKQTQGSVLARFKIMAGMKIQEKRIPQDGRIKLKVENGEVIDFRVSACPAYHGESIVLRILRPEAARIGLRNLGMREDTLEKFHAIIRRPNGIFLVTGPTGSGKTTTLYSALDDLNTPDTKIITAEDPIEYNFKGINQCQVNNQIGLTFQTILRAMLRQAPNIILVGEIRDREVGEVAVQAALTGHMVFSTLHTNDAPSSMTRLTDMGLKPFLVASSVQAVLAQRLVRMLCPHCKEPDTKPDPKLMRLCAITREDVNQHTVYRAAGCARCSNTGYRGRKGIYELMVMNSQLRELTFKRSSVAQLRKAAIASGMRNLLGDGKLKILEGLTTLEEIARIAQVEGVVESGEEEETLVAPALMEGVV